MLDASIKTAIERIYHNESLRSVHLSNLRTTAARRMNWWCDIVGSMQVHLPEYTVHDFTELDNDVSFAVEIVLVGPSVYDRDDIAMARRLGGSFDYLQAFASILGPWSYVMGIRMSVDPGSDLPRFDKLHKSVDSRIENVWNFVEHCFTKESMHTLPYDVAASPVSVGTDCVEMGKACVFHCLFSDILSP